MRLDKPSNLSVLRVTIVGTLLLTLVQAPASGLLLSVTIPPEGFSETKIFPDGLDAFSDFGSSVAADRTTVVVGAPFANAFSGAAYVYKRQGGTWRQVAILTASDAEFDSTFGEAVDIHKKTIVVGARSQDGAAEQSGAAYVFEKQGRDWVETTKLTAKDAGESALERFGNDVGVSGDFIVIGSRQRGDDGLMESGAAYVFMRRRNARGDKHWKQIAKLTAETPDQDAQYGNAVAIDRKTIAVGAHFQDAGTVAQGPNDEGAVDVYRRKGKKKWKREATLLPDQPNSFLGTAIDLSGKQLIAGAIGDESAGVGVGAVYNCSREARRAGGGRQPGSKKARSPRATPFRIASGVVR